MCDTSFVCRNVSSDNISENVSLRIMHLTSTIKPLEDTGSSLSVTVRAPLICLQVQTKLGQQASFSAMFRCSLHASTDRLIISGACTGM